MESNYDNLKLEDILYKLSISSLMQQTEILKLLNKWHELKSEVENEANLIEACKYGYNYHKTSQFPELEFENACRQNFLQILENKKYV